MQSANYAKAAKGFFQLTAEASELGADATVYSELLEKFEPITLDRARMGWAYSTTLADINDALEQLVTILDIVNGSPEFTADAAGLEHALSFLPEASGGIDNSIDSFLSDVRDLVLNFVEPLAQVKKNPEFNWVIDKLPITFLDINLMDVGGEYDLGEVNGLLAIGYFLIGAIDGARGINFDFNVLQLEPIFYGLDKFDSLRSDFAGSANPEDIEFGDQVRMGVIAGLDILAILLHENPNFLGIDKQSNLLKQGAEASADGFGHILSMINHVREDAKTDPDQSDDVIGYVVEDDEEFLEIHFEFSYIISAVQAIPQLEGFDPEKLENIRIPIPESVESAIQNMEAAFRGTSDGRVYWARDIVPVISLAIVTILQSGAINGVIENIAGDGAGSSVNSLLNSSLINTDTITGIITSIIPDTFRFNVAGYVANPDGGLRVLFPLWSVPQEDYGKKNYEIQAKVAPGSEKTYTVFQSYDQYRFMIDYECFQNGKRINPLFDNVGFTCDEENVRDARHFEDYEVQQIQVRYDADDGQGVTWHTTAPGTTTLRIENENFDFASTTASIYDREAFTKYHEKFLKRNTLQAKQPRDIKHNEYGDEVTPGINPDGLESFLPYIAFQDASLGGLIEYNFSDSQVNLQDDSRTALQDLRKGEAWIGEADADANKLQLHSQALNATIHYIGEQVGGLLGNFD